MYGCSIDRLIRGFGFLVGASSADFALAVLLFGAPVASPAASPPHDVRPPLASPADFTVQESMVLMRDGIKLHTVVVTPAAHSAPMPAILIRTPYGTRFTQKEALYRTDLPVYLGQLDGYILVFQDIRGRHGSQGVADMERPSRGPFNRTTTDETTDAYDTVAWIVKQVRECDGGVGLMGTSYGGGLVLSALLEPHPAVKVAIAANPEVDLWRGDDYFHNGAFRQGDAFEYLFKMEWDADFRYPESDVYHWWLQQGSARDVQRRYMQGRQRFGLLLDHPSYDAFWQDQSLLAKLATSAARKVPTMFVQGLFDQEDIYGAAAAFAATRQRDREGTDVFVAGPWFHGQFQSDLGERIGNVDWESATAVEWRRGTFIPFLEHYLKSAPDPHLPSVQVFDTGEKRWQRSAALEGTGNLSLFLATDGRVVMQPPTADGHDSFVADPAKPTPYEPRPILNSYGAGGNEKNWQQWLAGDQRFVDGRPDVLTYTSDVLHDAMVVKGRPRVHLFAATTGSDADWVVKLIDVAPEGRIGSQPGGGYELMIAADIMRGRYRKSPSAPTAIVPNEVQEYVFELPYAAHTFLAGHRVMIQIQSSWFPLYDRNPQTFVPSIMDAPAAAYRAAIHTVDWGPEFPSRIDIPSP